MTVYFIGAGPGDPELITVKGQRLIHRCPVIIYAGSLVPQAVLDGHRAERVINSAELHLEQIIEPSSRPMPGARTWPGCIPATRACMAPSASRSAACGSWASPSRSSPGSPPPPPALPCWGPN